MKKIHHTLLYIYVSTFIINLIIIIITFLVLRHSYLYHVDTLHYLSIARTLYLDPSEYGLYVYGYFSHLIFYPLLIRIISPFNLQLGFILIGFIFWMLGLFVLVKIFQFYEVPERTQIIFLILSSGAINVNILLGSINGIISILFALTILSYYFYIKEKYLFSALCTALLAITHITALVVCVPYFFFLLFRKKIQCAYYILAPFFLVLHFFYFYLITGNFFVLLTSHSTTYNHMFPFGFFLGLFFYGVPTWGISFIPPFQLAYPTDIILRFLFLGVFFSTVYLSVKKREHLEISVMSLLLLIVVFNWSWTSAAIRILTTSSILLILNFKNLEFFNAKRMEKKSTYKKAFIIAAGLFIGQLINYFLISLFSNLLLYWIQP